MPPVPKEIEALANTRTIDLITVGRRSGEPRRVEIWWFHVDGRFVITGTPGRRDWLANVRSNPRVVISSPIGDFPGTVFEVEDPEFRHRVFTDPQIDWYRDQAELEHLISAAPMVEVRLH